MPPPSPESFHFVYHVIGAVSTAVLAHFLDLPARFFHGLHTYIHPDSLPPSSSRVAIRPPSAAEDSSKRHRLRRRRAADEFDESKAQLLRLRLSDSHLPSRPSFPFFRTAFIFFLSGASALLLHHLLKAGNVVPTLISVAAVAYNLYILLRLSLDRLASTHQQRQLSLLSALIGAISAAILTTSLMSAALAGILAGVLFIPAFRASRSFWLGTDQLRFNLSVISCSTAAKVLLYLSQIISIATPLLWINLAIPLSLRRALDNQLEQFRVYALAFAAVLQLIVIRTNVQMYLNEAVMCWYQRLHANKSPDMDYGRAKVFIHNHYFCLVAVQLLAPPAMVLVLVGLSQMRGNLCNGALFITSSLAECSDAVKEMSLFLAWWIMLVWAILNLFNLALYRSGILLIS